MVMGLPGKLIEASVSQLQTPQEGEPPVIQ